VERLHYAFISVAQEKVFAHSSPETVRAVSQFAGLDLSQDQFMTDSKHVETQIYENELALTATLIRSETPEGQSGLAVSKSGLAVSESGQLLVQRIPSLESWLLRNQASMNSPVGRALRCDHLRYLRIPIRRSSARLFA